ncbi:MAG: acyltransferase family protein, partial [Candidatus Nanopelagicus sp.]
PGLFALFPAFGTFLLITSIGAWPKLMRQLANNKITQWLGAISYSLYLWHWPVLLLPKIYLDRPLLGIEKVICVAITIILAHLTFKFVEQPIRYANLDTKTVYKTLGSSVIVIILASTLIITTSTTKFYVKEVNKTFDLVEISAQPKIYLDGCHASWGETNSSDCVYGDVKSNKVIVLFGDSHAAQWFEPLNKIAINAGYKLISLTKSACPAFDLPRVSKGAYQRQECELWQSNSLKRIKKLSPDFVIVSTFSHYNLYSKNNQKESYYLAGQKKLFAQLKDSSQEIVYLTDTPKPEKDIPNCLSTHSLSACNQIKRSSSQVYEEFIKIDPYRWFCETSCKVINDGYVVYRDASHISTAAALAVTSNLKASLIKAGLLS